MEIIQEDTVRQLYFRQGATEIRVPKGAYVTQQAKEYIREKNLCLIVEDIPGTVQVLEENAEIQPALEMQRGQKFVGMDGASYDKKPEHMTHLYGNLLVQKNHPRIVLRGKLDSLEAAIVVQQVAAQRQGENALVQDLEEILAFCRQVLSCEVTGKPLAPAGLLGFDEAGLREASQNPKKYFGCGHLLPGYRLGTACAGLNLLRTQSREAELAAVDAFCPPAGEKRLDLIRGLNRLSSAFYILMLQYAKKEREGGKWDG